MKTYILRRVVQAIPTLLIVSIVTFTITMLLPGDPALAYLGEQQALNRVAYDATRKELGLDQPLPVQYGQWLGRVLRGDLGRSVRTKEPVAQSIGTRLPVTLELVGLAMLLGLCIAFPVGILSAVRPNSKLDLIGTVLAVSGLAIPSFWLGIVLIFIFSLWLGWLPASGYISPTADLGQNLKLMILPAITLGVDLAAGTMRQIRSAMLEILQQEYIVAARAKGLSDRTVTVRHALRNALIPVVTIIGLQVGRLIGGTVVIETIFALPGMGRLAADAIFFRDFPSLQAVVVFLAIIVFVSNLVTDLIYSLLDPRIRYA